MPIFFHQQINESTRLGVWKIEESEEFFKGNVPQHRDVTHPHKRLQHLAGRFLLQFLFPDFPYELIQIADTRKPYLPDERYHFSISHCGDFAAAIVSRHQRVGIDAEIPSEKVERIRNKFLNEQEILKSQSYGHNVPNHAANGSNLITNSELLTVMWCAKECVFKWYGDGRVDFRQHIHLQAIHDGNETIDCFFAKTSQPLVIHYRWLGQLVMAWVVS